MTTIHTLRSDLKKWQLIHLQQNTACLIWHWSSEVSQRPVPRPPISKQNNYNLPTRLSLFTRPEMWHREIMGCKSQKQPYRSRATVLSVQRNDGEYHASSFTVSKYGGLSKLREDSFLKRWHMQSTVFPSSTWREQRTPFSTTAELPKNTSECLYLFQKW